MMAIGGSVRGGVYGTAASLDPSPANPTLENNGADVRYETPVTSMRWLLAQGFDAVASAAETAAARLNFHRLTSWTAVFAKTLLREYQLAQTLLCHPTDAFPIQDALGDLDAIDLAVAYGVPVAEDGPSLAVAAVTLRAGHRFDGAALGKALSVLPSAERPDIVHVVDEIPVTTWYRPATGALRAAGVGHSGRVGVLMTNRPEWIAAV